MMGVSKKLLWVFLFLLPLCVHAQQDSLAVSSEPVEQVEEGEQLPQLKPKFGFLSYSTVIRLMPEYAQAQEKLDLLQKRYDEELIRADKEFNLKFAEAGNPNTTSVSYQPSYYILPSRGESTHSQLMSIRDNETLNRMRGGY